MWALIVYLNEQHFWHVAPVVFAFLILLGKQTYDRYQGKPMD